MTLGDIQLLRLEDFNSCNEEVWEAIATLTVAELETLLGRWGKDIDSSISDIINEKNKFCRDS
jgi:hypothetical protein